MHREDGVTDVPSPPSSRRWTCWSITPTWSSNAGRHRDDLTSALLEAEIDGDRLGDGEIGVLFLMVVTGNRNHETAWQRGVLGW